MSPIRTGSGGSPGDALDRLRKDVRVRSEKALATVAATLATEIDRQLTTPGQGRYYAKISRAAGDRRGPLTVAEAVSLAKRKRRARALNSKRNDTARLLNAGTIDIGSITSKRVLTGLHRASKPGDPPAPDTGTLRNSRFIEKTERGLRVGVAMPYAQPLEFGTTRAGRQRKTVILPRPFMRPALAAVRDQMGEVFRATMRGRS